MVLKKQLIFEKMDLFAASPPHFNIEGQAKINTSVGFLLSGILVVIVLAFTTTRFILLL